MFGAATRVPTQSNLCKSFDSSPCAGFAILLGARCMVAYRALSQIFGQRAGELVPSLSDVRSV